jgi:hypothetical protein
MISGYDEPLAAEGDFTTSFACRNLPSRSLRRLSAASPFGLDLVKTTELERIPAAGRAKHAADG